MNEDEVRALAREEIRKAFEELKEGADYWCDAGELKSSAAYVLSDAADRVARSLTPPVPEEPTNPFAPSLATWSRPPCQHIYTGSGVCAACDAPRTDPELTALIESASEPVNPFAPIFPAQEWADRIRELIRQAEADGYTVWIDTEDYFGPGPFVKIGTADSPADTNPIICEGVEAK